MISWEQVRHQVAITGRVTDMQTSRPISSARITVSSAPAQTTITGADGHFHFIDLPDGQYACSVSLPGAGSRYGSAQVSVTVTRDGEGNIKLAAADVALPPTSIRGQVTGANNSPVMMAQVRIKGSGEQTFTDATGQYVLSGVEVGNRTILVIATGYQPASQVVSLATPGAVQTANISLAASP